MPHNRQTARVNTPSEVTYVEVPIDWEAVIRRANGELVAKENRLLREGKIQRTPLTMIDEENGAYYFLINCFNHM